ncbi:MAG: helix-turn-helix domain-containing protein [Verrucomicrobiales bacterium]|jgi:transcriptional regulator with XRE-family HTH domain|nr:helix-turn-helix domain-containing protein [Verrucomicrobiales bacterium]
MDLGKIFGNFLQHRRGDATYADFGRRLGITASTAYRLERCRQSPTLRLLDRILTRLNCNIRDVFHPRRRPPMRK